MICSKHVSKSHARLFALDEIGEASRLEVQTWISTKSDLSLPPLSLRQNASEICPSENGFEAFVVVNSGVGWSESNDLTKIIGTFSNDIHALIAIAERFIPARFN